RALARIYSNYTYVIVRADARINRIEDMRGKTIATGAPDSGTEVIAERLLKIAGLDPDRDIRRQRLALAEATYGMRTGLFQGMFWSGGLPTNGIKDLFTAVGSKLKILDLRQYLDRMQSRYNPLYTAAIIPHSYYHTAVDVASISVPNLILVRDTMSDDLAYKLVELLFDHQAELVGAQRGARRIDLKTAQETGEVVLHSGAKRYYAEQQRSG